MRITRIHIENFRSIRDLSISLGETNVFIGPNNAGKTAILDAVRIVLTRRWGQKGTGFTENDVHRAEHGGDPRNLPPVTITLTFEEPLVGAWDPDMVAALNDIMAITADNRNVLTLRVTSAWNPEKESFDPAWQFLNAAGEPFPERRRAINLTGFFSYVPIFWLGALRDAAQEFLPRSGHWGRLLKSVRIPNDLEAEALEILAALDARIVDADPRLNAIAQQIGQATNVAVGEGPGAARVNTLPSGMEEMLQRTGIVIRNEESRPWLPLSHHGQGLQSLAVIFLFQAAVLQQLEESDRPGIEAIFAIEEPETHLHPQAARTLLEPVQGLSGQKLMTTHSPYFVQHVPLRDLHIVSLHNGQSQIAALPERILSGLPWNASVEGVARGPAALALVRDAQSNCVAGVSWFGEDLEARLIRCYRRDSDAGAKAASVRTFRHNCRILPSRQDEEELGFHGRRIRGEIFFARRWIMVEGVTEYLLLHALGKSLNWSLDAHGVSVVDFQQSGNAGIYPALAAGFGIPWHMIVDGDPESQKFRRQVLDRGFLEADLAGPFLTLPTPNTLEDQLVADGHGPLLREILTTLIGAGAEYDDAELVSKLKKRKTGYMGALSLRVAAEVDLAVRMPAPFVTLVTNLRDGIA